MAEVEHDDATHAVENLNIQDQTVGCAENASEIDGNLLSSFSNATIKELASTTSGHVTYDETTTAQTQTIPNDANAKTTISSSKSKSKSTALSQQSSPPLILCDAWYGFPTQKRPRRERICAVSRQLDNFLKWRAGHYKDLCGVSNGEGKSVEKDFDLCHVCLLGNEGDVEAVRNRMVEISNKNTSHSSSLSNSTVVEEEEMTDVEKEMIFTPNIDIPDFLTLRKDNNNQTTKFHSNNEEEVVYLSPDAPHTLSTTSPPPSTVIIGMLIDRRITSHRSRLRAEETLNIRAVRLPLDELHVKELSSEEPLNVDVVMELIQRWWWNCDRLEGKLMPNVDDGTKVTKEDSGNEEKIKKKLSEGYKQCFVEAAAWAMKSQRERHPNRTVHINK